jgi:hypothetical protein
MRTPFTKTLLIKQDPSGQWLYKVTRSDNTEAVSWQYGPYDKDECIEQAKARFGSDMELAIID